MRRILIIEDEETLRTEISEVLKFEGFQIIQAGDGEAGLQLARAEKPDLILCDIMMPHMKGTEVLLNLLESESTSQIPFIFITALGERTDVRSGMELGADDYLVKPFAIDELLARVRALLRRRVTTEEATTLQVGDLVLDAARRQVTRNGREIHLTKTEFDLLEALMLRAGLVVTRDQLYEEIWGYDFETGSKSLDVYIGYLRRKTEENGEPRIVFTVRGVGYTVKA